MQGEKSLCLLEVKIEILSVDVKDTASKKKSFYRNSIALINNISLQKSILVG